MLCEMAPPIVWGGVVGLSGRRLAFLQATNFGVGRVFQGFGTLVVPGVPGTV